MNLGIMAIDTAHLEDAATAYRAALEVNTREAMPAERAETQTRLGVASAILAVITRDTAHLERAIELWKETKSYYKDNGPQNT